MNTITKSTVLALAQAHELRRIELQAEGFMARGCAALSADRIGVVKFLNGCEHKLVLPVGKMAKWAKLAEGDEIGVEFNPQNELYSLRLSNGGSVIEFLDQVSKLDTLTPAFTLDAGPTHDGEFKLTSGGDIDGKIKTAKQAAAAHKRLAAIAKLKGQERKALDALKASAKEHCERVALLAKVQFSDAVKEAKSFRDARRFVRRTVAAFTVKPEWLASNWHIAWGVSSLHDEPGDYEYALLRYNEAVEKSATYKPRKAWSRHAEMEIEKRADDVKACKARLIEVLRSAAKRYLEAQPAAYYWKDFAQDVWRGPGDAAYGFFYQGSYHKTRKEVRERPLYKAQAVNEYISAREARINAESKI